MDKEKLLNEFLESHGVEVSRLSKDAEKQYKDRASNTLGFQWFVLRESIGHLMERIRNFFIKTSY